MVPVEDLPPLFQRIGFFLPMTPGTGLLRRMMAQDQPLDFGFLAVALLNGAVYFALGVWAFAVAVRLVKRRGRSEATKDPAVARIPASLPGKVDECQSCGGKVGR